MTGTGVVTSLGSDLREVWNRTCSGESGFRTTRRGTAGVFSDKGSIREMLASMSAPCPMRLLRRMDRFVQLAMIGTWQAIHQSKIEFPQLDSFRCGVIIGSSFGGLHTLEEQHHRLQSRGPARVSAFMIPGLMVNAASANIAVHWNLKGPSQGMSVGCASGSHAIASARQMIQSGAADLMICGGAEAPLTEVMYAGLTANGLLNSEPADVVPRCCPFDRNRTGVTPAEGAAVLILENLETARRRGAEVLAEFVGSGQSFADPVCEVSGVTRCMRDALTDAGIEPGAIDYISAHGTGSISADRLEASAIRRVFGSDAQSPAVSSVKGQVGHTFGASGAIDAALLVECLRQQTVPPCGGLQSPDPNCALNHVISQPQALPLSAAMSNCFSYTGHNASLIFRRAAESQNPL